MLEEVEARLFVVADSFESGISDYLGFVDDRPVFVESGTFIFMVVRKVGDRPEQPRQGNAQRPKVDERHCVV